MNATERKNCAQEILDYFQAVVIDYEKVSIKDVLCILNRYHPDDRRIDAKERAKGRSEDYWQMGAEEQWAEDKRLGILDWDGN